MDAERFVKISRNTIPAGRWSLGRPKRRWSDLIKTGGIAYNKNKKKKKKPITNGIWRFNTAFTISLQYSVSLAESIQFFVLMPISF